VSWSDSIGEYRMEQRGHPGAVVVERRLELRAQTVPASEFPRVQALLRSAFAGDNASLLVR
jgi:hypothetical protein